MMRKQQLRSSNTQPRRTQTVSDGPRTPALRISHVAEGRAHHDGRVRYLRDPKVGDVTPVTPEDLVAWRWKRRQAPDVQFRATRLNPHVWRSLVQVLGPDTAHWHTLDEATIAERREAARARYERTRDAAHRVVVPQPDHIWALIRLCGPRVLARLVARHTAHDGPVFGVPDLLLYTLDGRTGRPGTARFVEVKKPDEPVTPEQRAEHDFMRSLGLHARVLRLMEPRAPRSSPRPRKTATRAD